MQIEGKMSKGFEMNDQLSERDQVKLITSHQWDFLFILDACRYDYYEKIHSKYLGGVLKKVISPASETLEWCKKVFTSGDFSDIIYVSANPYINSKVQIRGFNPKAHFYRIIDVWDFGWSDQLNTVPPEEVNKAVLEAIRKYPDRRFIIHYLQPHAPYICFAKLGFRQYSGFRRKSRNVRSPIKQILSRALTKLGKSPYIPKYCIFKGRQFFGLEFHARHFTWLKLGKKELHLAYKSNVEYVLESLSKLLIKMEKDLEGKRLVITSDHGEFLGEKETYSHFQGSRNPILTEVPWVELEI